MPKYKVVCNQGDYAYTFESEKGAKKAASNHSKRTRHNPVFIYELEKEVDLTRTELLAISEIDESKGILKIELV